MAPSAKHRGCTICGSPDAACGGHTATGVAVIQIPQSSPKFSGPVVEAMRPGPNGPYRVQARQDEAEAKGWQLATPALELLELGGGWFELPDGTKVQGAGKARSALNKARAGPGGNK